MVPNRTTWERTGGERGGGGSMLGMPACSFFYSFVLVFSLPFLDRILPPVPPDPGAGFSFWWLLFFFFFFFF
ncbi:hypothetical protein QBC42DRAFT_276018, partial [Cladorrhinum samala]